MTDKTTKGIIKFQLAVVLFFDRTKLETSHIESKKFPVNLLLVVAETMPKKKVPVPRSFCPRTVNS